jgi:hypothetical protein
MYVCMYLDVTHQLADHFNIPKTNISYSIILTVTYGSTMKLIKIIP